MNTFLPLALITGAAHRIGRAMALTLARNGYAIALHYHRSRVEAEQTAAEITALGVPVHLFPADLTDEAQIDTLFAGLDDFIRVERLDGLRVLVNSAAVMPRGDARTLASIDFDHVIATNLRAPFLCAQRAYQRMEEKGGNIINISDIGARKTWSAFPAYTVSKAALDALTRVLARSYAPAVRVNAIAPGLILPPPGLPSAEWQRLVERQPLRRAAHLDEITSALEFLIKNEYITGEVITIDGGYGLI